MILVSFAPYPKRVCDLLSAFKTQVGPTQHQQGRDQPWREIRQQQTGGQQEDQLVLQRPFGDAPDDRQFAVGLEAADVFRGHGGVVDDSTRGFGAGLGGLAEHIIHAGRGHFCNRCYIIQQG